MWLYPTVLVAWMIPLTVQIAEAGKLWLGLVALTPLTALGVTYAVRELRMRVDATDHGVKIRNLMGSHTLAWKEIRGFHGGETGRVQLRDGSWIRIRAIHPHVRHRHRAEAAIEHLNSLLNKWEMCGKVTPPGP